MIPSELLSLLPDLATFARVVETGNFSTAARLLGTTPSTVSRQMQRLERALGTRLLERSTRSIRLTESGTQVYRHCQNMVEAATDAVDVAGHLSEQVRGQVSISAPIAYAKSVVHPLMDGFLRAHPQVGVQLLFDDGEIDPVRDPVDLALRMTSAPPQGLVARRLGTVRWMTCASFAYLSEHGMPDHPQALRQHNCLYIGDHAGDNRWTFHRGDQAHTVEVGGRYIVNDVETRREAALAGWGIASLPEFAVADALREGELVQVLREWSFEPRAYSGPVWLLYPQNRFLPLKVRAMIDWLMAHRQGGS
ncbi:LysR family transcriptional regulator [Bordetella sp. FB-8]|uniref:LysR family transcriptional regulator n=1 Tax=Bordetella sp. FB-8 TaxID=1159870 RepID=UPI000378C604|nr:LysR family transcriptional regulator [Bordetella sp. FB-8]